ncbi:MAG: hypothetical protein DMG17_01820 [Acidobacteria bacterium]|nr:MAG: hypothetical protein DMG17_01820 [Acidobacteriota bacterium]
MHLQVVAIAFVATVVFSLIGVQSQNTPQATVAIDPDDIGGVVTSSRGPEAGVWVIAETRDTPTRLVKSVVTDDRGRYLIPDLPKANYDVWVRGYGLVDSPKVKAAPGKQLNLSAMVAPAPGAAAQYYPAQYWYALLELPRANEFPGTGENANGIATAVRSQGEWIRNIVGTDGCTGCHQMGNRATREIPEALGTFPNSAAAWERRIQSGQAGNGMNSRFTQVGRPRAFKMFADWTDKIAHGTLPDAQPQRPQGKERNVVVTMWDWADPKVYMHDEIASDKRNPTVNANGPVYGALEAAADYVPVVDPVKNAAGQVKLTVRDPKTPSEGETKPMKPSPYWGDEAIWTSQANAHSFSMDKQARVWIAARVRQNQTTPFCREGSNHPSAKAFPIVQSGRQIQVYDPKTKQVTTIDTCFGTHHLNLDDKDVLWFSGSGVVEGFFNTRVYLETKDEQKAQGWTPFILDTNGNGKRDAFVDVDQAMDPTKDKRINVPFYGVGPSPVDGAIWGSTLGMPGGIVRLVPGSDPTNTALAEYYEVPFHDTKASGSGFAPRGMDVDSKDVVWTTLSSGQLANFDRRKCKAPLNGPNATGKHCPEGWSFYAYPGPNYKNAVDSASADSAYYNFVDRFDMLGLGKDVPLATGNESEGLLALIDGKFLTFRIPYPMGYYGKGLDGRIDDTSKGWKGKGIWATYATRAPFHMEGGKGTTSKVIKFQVRPDPLSK